MSPDSATFAGNRRVGGSSRDCFEQPPTVSGAGAPGRPAGTLVDAAVAEKQRHDVGDGLKVLHIFRYFRPDFTGEGLYLEKLARHLNPMNIAADVAVECTRRPSHARSADGIGRTRFFGMGTGQQRRFPRAMSFWLAMHAFRYDVVHFHSFVDRLFLFHLIGRLSGCRIVQSCTLDDGLGSVLLSYRPLYRPLLRRLCGLIDAAIAISPRLQADNLAVLPADRSVLIPQGVNLPAPPVNEERARWRASWGFQDKDVVLLFVGGMCVRKDVMFLIENHAALPVGGAPVKLMLIGPQLEDGYVDALRQAIAASPRRDDIILEGYMDDPSPAYAAADVFVFASQEEGFGNVLIEAMSWGLPVVSRRLTEVTDRIIDDQRTGHLFDTPAGYREAVETLVNDAERRRTMGDAARDAVRERFDMRVIAARYAALYRGLVATSRRRSRR